MAITNKNRIALLVSLFPMFALSQQSRIDSLFDHLNSNTPGIAITLVQNEKVIYSKGHGMASLAYSIPFTDTQVAEIYILRCFFSGGLPEKSGFVSWAVAIYT